MICIVALISMYVFIQIAHAKCLGYTNAILLYWDSLLRECLNAGLFLLFSNSSFFSFPSFFFLQTLIMVEASITRYYTLEDKEYYAPSYYPRTDYKNYQSAKTPIVIDNGNVGCVAVFA